MFNNDFQLVTKSTLIFMPSLRIECMLLHESSNPEISGSRMEEVRLYIVVLSFLEFMIRNC